ncbi:hypothetical protein [Streptomyces sp. NPDC008122]|uniref:hypothetical protein n=1 Tax=Streptomyces sp. NPDC008122 TaxID=3364810 RepID=UPI0036EF5E88
MASDAAKPCDAMVRGVPSRTRCTGGSPSHASPGAVEGVADSATGSVADSAPDDLRARHFSNMPILSDLLSP